MFKTFELTVLDAEKIKALLVTESLVKAAGSVANGRLAASCHRGRWQGTASPGKKGSMLVIIQSTQKIGRYGYS